MDGRVCAENQLELLTAVAAANPNVVVLLSAGSSLESDWVKDCKAPHSWGWIEENNFQAIENYFYPTKQTVDNIAKDRPHWSEMTKEQYYASVGPNGAMFVGDPAHVAQKIIRIIEDLQLDRFMLHLPIGSMPHEDVLKAIKLYGEEVAPIVRRYFENKG